MSGFAFKYRRVIISTAASLSGIGGFSIYCLPNTIYKEKLKETIQLYRDGSPGRVPQMAVDLKEEVMKDMGFPADEIHRLSLFIIYGFDFYHLGSLKRNLFPRDHGGALIGIPISFGLSNLEELKKLRITTENSSVSWGLPEGQQLSDALLLSEDAQKFVLAREITMASSDESHLKGAMLGSCMALASSFLGYAHGTPLFRGYSPTLKFTVYGTTLMLSFIVFLFSNAATTSFYEKYADNAAAAFGRTYTVGAVEFYRKVLQRNIALRSLSEKGESFFTKDGNEKALLRVTHVALTKRLQKMEKLKDYLEDQT